MLMLPEKKKKIVAKNKGEREIIKHENLNDAFVGGKEVCLAQK